MMFAQIPVIIREGEEWLVLSTISNRGILRATRIDKRKKQVLDWDGHHCDEAGVKGSIRYNTKRWSFNNP